MLAQISTPPTTGDGSIGAPYEIETLENLYWISENGETWGNTLHYIQTADIDASETKNWTTVGWKPIGNSSATFNGTYNGQGYTISNLYIKRKTTDYIGLFGFVTDATIKNLGLNHVDITGRQYTGGLVGRAVNSNIDSCYTSGAITGTSYVGGFAGNAYGSTLNYSHSSCNVTGTGTVGGFIGSNSYGVTKYSFSTGVVHGVSSVGGFVGWNAAGHDTRLCYSHSRVDRLSGTNTKIGRFAGHNTSGIIFSYATGRVTYSGATNPTNKGFIGDNSGTFQNNFFDNQNSFQTTGTGAIARSTADMMQETSYTGWDFTTTWGLVGADYPFLSEHAIDSLAPLGDGTIENPYQIATLQNIYWLSLKPTVWDKHFIQTTNIDASPTSFWFDGRGLIPIGTISIRFSGTYNGAGHIVDNLHISRPTQQNVGFFGVTEGSEIADLGITNANVTGYASVGILAGSHGRSASFTTLIQYCYTSGNAFGNLYTGGLAGYVSDAQIKDSYSMANANRLSGTNASFGPFAGHNDESSFIHNYSIGNIYYFNGSNPTDKAFIGSDQNTVIYEDNFFDNQVSNQNSSIGATAKTTVQLQNPETFASWDFGTWLIDPAINEGYPYLLPYRALVQTSSVVNITSTSVVTGGDVTEDNGYTVTQKGVVWSTLPNPTVDVNEGITNDGAGTGTYVSNIANLDPGTEYYVRAYAISSKGNSYGEQLSFISTPSGSGTEIDPFQIGNLTQLKWMNHNEDYWDKHFIQIADINASPVASWNSGEGWKPLGYFIKADSFNYFTGSYDGQEYTIDSLFINNTSAQNQGFFGYAKNATIKNLVLENIDFTGSSYLGGLVGISIDNEIKNTHIVSASINGTYYVGGICGRSITSTVGLCQSSGNISGNNYVGGLIGQNITTSIDSSHSTCTVHGLENIGGLVGINKDNAAILNSSSISLAVTGNDVVGGLAGKNDNSRIENCFRNGDVTSSATSSNTEMGGLVGANINGSIIKNSFSENGKVSRGGAMPDHYSISSAGGLAGSNNASTIVNCHSTFDITHGNGYVGGLVGYNADGVISSSFATGNVIGASGLGGLVGQSENASVIINCYSRGTITIKEQYAYSATTFGGLVGRNTTSTISNTYSTGGIYYEVFGIPNPYSKGLVGEDEEGVYSSNFFNTTLSNQSSSTGATAITSEQMQEQETFAGWDFSNVWGFEAGVNDEFPVINAADLPVVVITAFSDTTTSTNAISADVLYENGSAIIAKGIVWDIVPNPDITNNIGKSNEATDDTSFVTQIENLLPGKTYYARPYAENSIGTAYGNEAMFITEGAAPSITTKSIANITETSALGGGIITTDGDSPVAVRGIVWGTNPNPSLETNEGTSPGTTETADFESPLTGLTPNTTYYVRAYATNGEGTGYGNEVQFSTATDLPALTTKSISSITDNSAMGGGIVNSDGGSAITARGIVWGTSSNPTLETNEGTSPGTTETADFESPLTGLTPNTTYYVRAYATNVGGTGYGNELTFSTVEMYYTMTFVSNSSEGGIASLAAGQSEGPFPAGALVNIQAIANEGYQFVEWTLNGVTISTEADYTYTMPAENISLTAVFSIANNIDISSLYDMCAYPNPFYDQIYLKNVTGKLKVEVTNIQGHKIYVKQLNGNYKINTSQLVPGIYFIRLEYNDGQTRVVRMTKE